MQDNLSTTKEKHQNQGNALFFWWAIWCILGTAFAVVLNLAGFLPEWKQELKFVLMQPPFQMAEDVFLLPPLVIFCTSIAVTMFYTYVLMRLRTLWGRLLFLMAATVSMLLFIPVFALWGIYFNTFGIVLSLLFAGIGASGSLLFLKTKELESSPDQEI